MVLTRSVRETEDDTSQREQRSAVYPPSPRIVRVGNGNGSGGPLVPSARTPEPQTELLVDEFVGYLRELFDRRRSVPGDDLVSALLQVEEGGDTLSQEELAEASGLGPGEVRRVERGQRDLSVIALADLARALDIQPADLMP